MEPGGRDIGRFVGQAQVDQDLSHRRNLHDGSDGFEIVAPAAWAVLHVNGEDAGQEFSPTDASGFLRCGLVRGVGCGYLLLLRILGLLWHDLGADLGMRREAAEESRQVDPGWGDNLSIIPPSVPKIRLD